MNQRIRELAEQSNLTIATSSLWEHKVQEFAELIVRECGLWFNNRLVVNPDYGIEHRVERNRAVIGVMKEFNQHFGVEQ